MPKASSMIASSHNYIAMPISRPISVCFLLFLAGCQLGQSPIDPVITSDPEVQLLGTAQSIDDSLKTLAEARAEDIPPALNTEPLISSEGGMGRKADIDWSGPIEPFVQKVADLSEYHVKVFGPTPSIPVIISVTGKDLFLADALKDAGMQAGKRATVMVFPKSRVIELRYTVD